MRERAPSICGHLLHLWELHITDPRNLSHGQVVGIDSFVGLPQSFPSLLSLKSPINRDLATLEKNEIIIATMI